MKLSKHLTKEAEQIATVQTKMKFTCSSFKKMLKMGKTVYLPKL